MRVIIPPTIEPITVDEVKGQLGILSNDLGSDGIILRRIIEARQWAEDYMQRALITQTLEIRLDNFPQTYSEQDIRLPFPNLLSIVHVNYIDQNGTELTVNQSDYVVDTYNYIGAVRPIYGITWPSARQEVGAVRVQYTAGYGATVAKIPELIREGLMLLVGHWVNFQPQSENGTTIARVPFAVRDIFDKYAVVKFA